MLRTAPATKLMVVVSQVLGYENISYYHYLKDMGKTSATIVKLNHLFLFCIIGPFGQDSLNCETGSRKIARGKLNQVS